MQDEDDAEELQGSDFGQPLDPVSDRVRSVALLLRELGRLPPEHPAVAEGIELMRTVREGLRPRDGQTRH
jgi:hypothetical protein